VSEKKGPIVFKSEDSMWRMLEDGTKKFDVRRWDMADDRIYRLSFGQKMVPVPVPGVYIDNAPVAQRKPWVPEEKSITFLNKATGETLTFEYRGVEFVDWAPSWCFLQLGERIELPRHPNDEGIKPR